MRDFDKFNLAIFNIENLNLTMGSKILETGQAENNLRVKKI
jgi:hypothetical protein